MLSDVEIAQSAKMKPISEIAKKVGLQEDDLELYGKYKAKISLSAINRLENNPCLLYTSNHIITLNTILLFMVL